MPMTTSGVECQDCGASSEAIEWGFVLLARHGWTAQIGQPGTEPAWHCPACAAESKKKKDDAGDLTMTELKAGRRLRVLLVDDQVLVLRATAGMLRELDVVTANSGAEALARLAEGSHFDVMVSDVAMPAMNGAELYARIRQLYPFLAERFLWLSGDSYGAAVLCMSVARREGLGAMPKILDKPVPRNVLVREIEGLGQRGLPRSGTFAIADAVERRARAK